jgi:hypothetical protein
MLERFFDVQAAVMKLDLPTDTWTLSAEDLACLKEITVVLKPGMNFTGVNASLVLRHCC